MVLWVVGLKHTSSGAGLGSQHGVQTRKAPSTPHRTALLFAHRNMYAKEQNHPSSNANAEPVNSAPPPVKAIKRIIHQHQSSPLFPQVNNTYSAALDIRPVCPFPVVYKVHDAIFPSSPRFVTSASPRLIAAAPVIRLLKHSKPIFGTEQERKKDIIAASHWGKASSSAG